MAIETSPPTNFNIYFPLIGNPILPPEVLGPQLHQDMLRVKLYEEAQIRLAVSARRTARILALSNPAPVNEEQSDASSNVLNPADSSD